MLLTLDPLLTPELLLVLASMGHGDDLVLVDENFPAVSSAVTTSHGSAIRLPGVGLPETVRAVASVFPFDDAEPSVSRMQVADDPHAVPDVQKDVLAELPPSATATHDVQVVERFAFYEATKRAYAVVWTGEHRFYGCFIFKKGVVPPATPSGQ
jgi:L-fucose mutarotase